MPKLIDSETEISISLEERLKEIMDKKNPNSLPNETFADKWKKGIPATEVFNRLEQKVRDLWQK